MKTASELHCGERGIISDVDTSHPSCARLLEIGFTPGQEIQLVNSSLFKDPMAFSLRGTLIAVRKHEADCIILS